MKTYKSVRIGDIGDVITGKTPPTKDRRNYGKDFMFVGPSDLHQHFIIENSEKMISSKGLDSIKSSTLNGVSILVGCIGWDMGNVGITTKKCATNQQINSITNISSCYNPFYIYYWLKGKKEFLFSQANVTRTPILNKTNFSDIVINLPAKVYQDKVAECLINIDKKIALNNRINAELEAMVKTLYDYWFVQFDFSDANGKPYKTSGGKMVFNKSLNRELPEGWENMKIADCSSLHRGVTYGKEDVGEKEDDNVVGILRSTNITGNQIDLDDLVYISPSMVSEEQFIKKFQILIVMSSGSKNHIGKNGVYYFNNISGFGAFCSKLSVKNEFIFYIITFLNSDWFKNYIKNQCLGTNINNLTNDHITECPLVMPDKKVLKLFQESVSKLYEKIATNSIENQTLKELRDWLLPVLMNGQVTVK